MALDVNEIRIISREVKEAKRKKEREKLDIAWESRVLPSIENTVTLYAENGGDDACIYIYDRFWELGKVIIYSEEDFSYVLNLIKEHFEGFKVYATYDYLMSKRKITISWAEDIEEDIESEDEEDDDELPF